jgi:hypothetical protein
VALPPAFPFVLAAAKVMSGQSDTGEMLMARSPSKPFHCSVISENVSIALRRRSSFRGDGKLYVQCSEVDCQWIDANEPPCPLTLDLFADEIKAREAQRAE